MILLDDILLAPARSLGWIFRCVHRAAQEEMADERREIRARLGELYRRLERGEIPQARFEEEERRLLDRLDAIGGQEVSE